jgi:CheY-like chemotaxis protein
MSLQDSRGGVSAGIRQPRRGRPTVLLVDDEVFSRLDLAERLRERGFDVIEAGRGQEAIDILLMQTDIDAVITDVQMPGDVDGVELARFIERARPELPVLIMSGLPRPAPDDLRIAATLRKPCPTSEIVQHLRLALRDANADTATWRSAQAKGIPPRVA